MSVCTRCAAPNADLLSDEGEPLCRGCYYTGEIDKTEGRVPGTLIKGGIGMIILSVLIFAMMMAMGIRSRRGKVYALPSVLLVGGILAMREGFARRRARQEKSS